MKNLVYTLAFAVISLVMVSCSSSADFEEMDQEMAKAETSYNTTNNSNSVKSVDDGTNGDNVKVLVNNLFQGYEITDLVINGQQCSTSIAENGSVVVEVSSKEKINNIEIKCSIRSNDGSNQVIKNLSGVQSIANHGNIVTVNLNADFLGLTAISFDANVAGSQNA